MPKLFDIYRSKFFQLYINRVATFYLVIFFISLTFVDYKDIKEKFKIQTLNRFKPTSYKYLIDLALGKAAYNPAPVKQYLRYYQKVVENMPSQSGAYIVMGFCYSYLGDWGKALGSIESAVAMNPNVILYQYDLGVVHYKLGHYEEAKEIFKRVISSDTNPAKSFEYLSLSKVFKPLLIQAGINSEEKARGQLQEDYQNAYKLLILSYFHSGDFADMLRYSLAAIELALPSDDFYYLTGLAAYHRNQFQVAALYFKKYIEKRADNPDAYYYLGSSLKALGVNELAQKFLSMTAGRHTEHDEIISHIESVQLQIF